MPVRHIGLAGLVGQIRLEAHPARARALLGLRDHEAAAPKNPVDGRESGHLGALLAQVPGDGPGPGVEAVFGQALAPGHDRVLEPGRGEVGRHLGTPLEWYQGRLATLSVEGDVALDPRLRTPRGSRHVTHRASLDEHSLDAVAGQIHGTTSERVSQNC